MKDLKMQLKLETYRLCSHNCKLRPKIKQNKGPKKIENKIQLVCIKDLKNTCFRPKNDNERSKNVAEDGKSLGFAPTIAK